MSYQRSNKKNNNTVMGSVFLISIVPSSLCLIINSIHNEYWPVFLLSGMIILMLLFRKHRKIVIILMLLLAANCAFMDVIHIYAYHHTSVKLWQ